MKIRGWCLSLLVCLSSGASADDLDDNIRQFMLFHQIPGMSIGVVKDGVVTKRSYGFADLELGVKVRSNSVFKLGSVSKQFIASLVLLLEQDGKLQIDDRLAIYLPNIPSDWQAITIRQLLNHTSGMARDFAGPNEEELSLDEFFEKAKLVKLETEPGAKFGYSNLGYVVLGKLISTLANGDYGLFAEQRIFAPLGMKDTGMNDRWEVCKNRAKGYDLFEGRYHNSFGFNGVRPSGAFRSTIDDLLLWERALRSDNILSSASKEKLWSTKTLPDGFASNYGLGWELGEVGGEKMVSHSGANPGYTTLICRLQNRNSALIALSNCGGYPVDHLISLLSKHLTGRADDEEYAVVQGEESSRNLALEFMKARIEGRDDRGVLLDEIAKRMNWKAGALKYSQFGPIKSLRPVKLKNLPAMFTHSFEVTFEKVKLLLACQIVGKRIGPFTTRLIPYGK